jgi:YqaJ-like viral recombinase domain
MKPLSFTESERNRRHFIGGSDARVIMGQDEKALVRLWQEKRGEIEPEDLSTNLIVQLGLVTEDLNRQWYERNTGNAMSAGGTVRECGKRVSPEQSERKWCRRDIPVVLRKPESLVAAKTGARSREVSGLDSLASWGTLPLRRRLQHGRRVRSA